MSFGKWLREQRQVSNITMAELARGARITPAYIGVLEAQPRRIPSREIVDRMAKVLGVPLSEARLAAGYAPPELEFSNTTRELVSYFEQLPEDLQSLALEIVKAISRHEIIVGTRREQRRTPETVGTSMAVPLITASPRRKKDKKKAGV